MSLQFKNMAASITGQGYYANSIDISEQIEITHFNALGKNTSNSVTAKAPEGAINFSFYITTGEEISAITGQYGKTGFISVQAGPFSTNKALLSSFSVAGDPLSLAEGSVSYNYYGALSSGSPTSIARETILPVHGGGTTVDASELGVSSVLGFDYSVSQSHEVRYGIGGAEPQAVNFEEGTRELSIQAQTQDTNFAIGALTGTSGMCPNPEGSPGFSSKQASVVLKNLCSETVATLDISGYLESRDFSAAPNENVASSFSLTEKFPNSNIAGEC